MAENDVFAGNWGAWAHKSTQVGTERQDASLTHIQKFRDKMTDKTYSYAQRNSEIRGKRVKVATYTLPVSTENTPDSAKMRK